MQDYLTFAKQLALQAGDLMLQYFHDDVEQRIKSDKTIVTIADEAINNLVLQEVSKNYPDHSVFGEEGSTDKQSRMAWVCDPIDGTVLYAKGVPVSVFSLALVEDGSPIVGVIYDPFSKRLYSAAKGKGTYLNDQPVSVSSAGLERHSTVNVEWWPDAHYDVDTVCHKMSVDTSTYVLHLGTIIGASCRVASGQYEACVYAGTTNKNVDIAAVKIIVEEAGGKVTDLFGNEQRYDSGDINGALITNGVVHQEMVRRLRADLIS